MSSDDLLSPYKGLTPFDDSDLDAHFFFGRERECELIEANLMASRLTVLYGETGVGKSSVLRAGVAHHLRGQARVNLEERGEPGFAVVVFDSWRDEPVEALRSAVSDAVTVALGGELPAAGRGKVADRLPANLAGRSSMVICTSSSIRPRSTSSTTAGRTASGTFAVDFPEVVNSADLRVNFLLAVREDALAKLDVFRARIPGVLGNYLRLEHLDPPAARAAIVQPIAEYNRRVAEEDAVEIEPGLVEAVLDQVVGGQGRRRPVRARSRRGRQRRRSDRDALPPARDATAMGRGAQEGLAPASSGDAPRTRRRGADRADAR